MDRTDTPAPDLARGGSAEPPGAAPVRFRHVDSLRAVAAILVAWLHFDQFLRPVAGPDPRVLGFLHDVPSTLDVGRVGVVIFFSISGFVICRSFGGPREGSGRRFIVRRLCRLYPAYWVSIVGGIWVAFLLGLPLTWRGVVANVTMAPSLFGQGALLGVYWTLQVELIFYAVCLLLHRTRWLEWPTALAVTVLALTGVSRMLRIFLRPPGPVESIGLHLYALGLAVMIWGALFRTVYDQTNGFRRGTWSHRGTWLILGTMIALPVVLDPKVGWYLIARWPAGLPSNIATGVGIWFFAAWVAALRIDNRFLTYLGVISYSIYLFHTVVMFTLVEAVNHLPTLRAWNAPCWLYFIVAGLATTALAGAVYRWVERPAITLGKRWTGSDLPPADGPLTR